MALICAALFGETLSLRSATEPGALPPADAILSRYVQAIGGREAILKHRYLHLTGRFDSVELGFHGPLEVFAAAPNKRFVQVDLENYGRMLQGFDGRVAWGVEPQQDMRLLEASDLEHAREDADFYTELHEANNCKSIETVALSHWADRPAYELKLITRSGRELRKFFDADTGLLLGVKNGITLSETISYQDYQSFDGVMIPTSEVHSNQGLVRQVIIISAVDYSSIDSRRFDYHHYEPRLALDKFPKPTKNGSEPPDAIDKMVLREMERLGVPGLSLGVLRDGKLVKAEGYGLADIENHVLAQPETVFQLCSLTKPFTAFAVSMLVKSGRVELDEPINHYVTGISSTNGAITIRQILSHTAGLAREPYGWNALPKYDETTVLHAIFQAPPVGSAGAQWAYSNAGYYLMGILIHRVTGQDWHEWLSAKIFEPLEMTATSIIGPSKNRAIGYVLTENGTWRKGFKDRLETVNAAGGLTSSVLDLAKWDSAISLGKIISRKSWEEMSTRTAMKDGELAGYGLGWSLNLYRGHRVVEHTGGNMEGIRTCLARFEEDRLTVIVLCNWSKANMQAFSRRIADFYLDMR